MNSSFSSEYKGQHYGSESVNVYVVSNKSSLLRQPPLSWGSEWAEQTVRNYRAYLIASLLYMAVIFFLSSQSGDSGVGVPAPWDKLAHVLEYALLGFLLCRGLQWARWYWILAWTVAVLYGITDEIHQSFVPGRDASPWDAFADVVGAMVGIVLALYLPAGRVHRRGTRRTWRGNA